MTVTVFGSSGCAKGSPEYNLAYDLGMILNEPSAAQAGHADIIREVQTPDECVRVLHQLLPPH